jgi:putative phosphoribosyl transferase
MFNNREEAGELLALELKKIIKDKDFVVVALLRGGIVLGKKISDYFKIPLLPLSVKKIGAPMNPELAIGAVTFDKTHYFDKELMEYLDVDREYLKITLKNKRKEAENLQKNFKITSLKDKRVIIVDDGVATGTTVICASKYVKNQKAKEIILAIPVIAKESLKDIKGYFNKVIALKKVDNLSSVSQFYLDFPQVEDSEAIELTKI